MKKYAGLAIGSIALLVPVVVQQPAVAQVVSVEHYQFTETHLEQEEHGDEFCPDVEFPVLFEGEGRGTLLVKTKGSGPFPYFADRFQSTAVFTNLDNDKSLTQVDSMRFADQQIVDNGDGTITITGKGTGRSFVYGPDGDRLFVDGGQVRFSFVVDYNGTPENPDDDEFVEFLGEDKLAGRHDQAGRDFCADLVTFLG